MDGGAWWAAVYGVAQSRTRLMRLSSSSSIGLLDLNSYSFFPLISIFFFSSKHISLFQFLGIQRNTSLDW